jgi:endonuclease/exonuclease/phosphatase family metal-dependent hydrolase
MARLRLATFNCENLFARFKFNRNIDPQKAITDGWLANETKFTIYNEEEKELTAAAIRKAGADVIALQEVESLLSLKKFRNQYLRNMDYKYVFVVDGNDPRFIDVGILSRYPIEKIDTHIHERDEDLRSPMFSRDCLESDVVLPNSKRVRLFINHLKSMFDRSDPCNGRRKTRTKRLHQARRVREIVKSEYRSLDDDSGLFAILGDFNDYLETDAQGETAIADLVRWNKVVNVVNRLDEEERWTHYFKGNTTCSIGKSYRQLDYILLSKPLAERNASADVKIIRDGLPLGATRYTGHRFDNIGTDKPKASDHCPIVVHLEV